jgi:hypothetical protein
MKWVAARGALFVGLLTACVGPVSHPAGANPTEVASPPVSVSAAASGVPTRLPPVQPTVAALESTPDATFASLSDQIDQELKDLESSNEDQTLGPLLPTQ